MNRRHTSLILFLLAVSVPFLASFAVFVASARQSLLTTPTEHIAELKRTGSTTTLVSLPAWKQALARDELCRGARAVVIGSSRVREIDSRVTGTSTCNLYVDGLATGGLMRLARALPPTTQDEPPIVYIGVDHFWLWSADVDTTSDAITTLGDRSATAWKVWQVTRTLGFFEWRDLAEVVRRYRAGSLPADAQTSVWYPDGHLEHPRYYRDKRAGQHGAVTQESADGSAEALFTGHSVQSSDLARLADAVKLLHAKRYAVRLYWNPVSPGHLAAAQRHFGTTFQQAIDLVDREAQRLPLERYFPAAETLDPRRFGCTDRDYFDATHVDVDCLRRLFASVLRTDGDQPAASPSAVVSASNSSR